MKRQRLEFGFLDKSPIRADASLGDALHESVQTAVLLESFGFQRYWFAEHHNNPRFACAAPEIMAAQVLARTKSLKVGTGGVMISNYSPYKVAEVFSTLAILYPGRVELGFGMGHGMEKDLLPYFLESSDTISREAKESAARTLASHVNAEDGSMNYAHRHSPMVHGKPDLWMLGLTERSAELAANLGLNYCYGHLQAGFNQKPIQSFRRLSELEERKAMVAVHFVSTKNDADLELHAKNLALGLTPSLKRLHSAWPSREESASAIIEDQAITAIRKYIIVEDEAMAEDQLFQLLDEYNVDNVLIETIGFDFEEKIRILKALSKRLRAG